MTYQSVIYLQDGTTEVLPQVFAFKTEAGEYARRVADRTMYAFDGFARISDAPARTHYLDFFTGELCAAPEVEGA